MIAGQLNLARQREALASLRCQHLEGLLDHLDILPAAEDGHTGMRFPGDGPEAGQRPDLAALSPREWDVLALIAEGLSNRGIAKRLAHGDRFVERVVSEIFAKLGLAIDGRSQTDANNRVLATLAFLDATTRSGRPYGTSSSPDSPRMSPATGELASSGGVEDRGDQYADVVLVDAGDGVDEADVRLVGEAAG
jgi:DNA-binding CsgD family transcriptional regulator